LRDGAPSFADSKPKYDGITKRWAAVVSTDIGDPKNFQDMLTSGHTCIILSQLLACASVGEAGSGTPCDTGSSIKLIRPDILDIKD
jgi:hypothetical protein